MKRSARKANPSPPSPDPGGAGVPPSAPSIPLDRLGPSENFRQMGLARFAQLAGTHIDLVRAQAAELGLSDPLTTEKEAQQLAEGLELGAVPWEPEEQLQLRVVSLPRNPRIVYCTHPSLEGNQRVKVRNSALFVPGMDIPARRLGGDLWEFVGRHLRWRGDRRK